MAEASSAALTTTAAQLREAAKQTMRRKQAPVARPVVPTTRNGPLVSSTTHSSFMGSSAIPSPSRLPPKGPRGVATLSMTNTVPLNYGDPNDSPIADRPVHSGGARFSEPIREQEPRRMSASRVRASAGNAEELAENGANREEGEISDEEIRAKRLQQDPAIPNQVSALPADPALVKIPVPASVSDISSIIAPSGPTESTKDADISVKGAVRRSTRTRSTTTKPAPVTVPTTAVKRSNTSGGMQPPPPPINVHREPAPISPVASIPTVRHQPSTRSFPSDASSGATSSVSKVKPPPPPSLQTHSFESLVTTGTEDSTIEVSDEEGEEMGELSPKTAQLNQDVFTQLLKMGVDEHHCRPDLPMTFQQFSDAKGLILDLLGLGMTPENIADIGINRRLLVYCLRELKIRLPANVPVDDIISFGPPHDSRQDDSREDSELPSAPHSPQNDDLQSATSMEITPIDRLIAEKVSESPPSVSLASPPLPPVASETSTNAAPSSPPSNQLSKLNRHSESSLPAKPPQTTGPSLIAMALPGQQIPPLPAREHNSISISLPSSLPARPQFSFDAASSRRSTAGSSSAGTIVGFSAPTKVDPEKADTEMETPQQGNDLLKKLEQETKLLLRQKMQIKKEGSLISSTSRRRDSVPLVQGAVLDPEPQHQSTILGGERVGSPSPMEVDQSGSQAVNPNPELKFTTVPPASIVMPKRPPLQLRATLSRTLASTELTRPSTPSDNGPKRGVKRPKADDFVEDNMPAKKSARLNGATNLPPLKRSSFAIANSAPPEQLIITWIDDEGVEIPAPAPWDRSKEYSAANTARDSEAAQLAAAAMALGLSMTAEELEAARLQEERRKAQINAKAEKLFRTQVNLKRLELKKAEKKLVTLQSVEDQLAVLADIVLVQNMVETLKQELGAIQARLPSPQSVEYPRPSEIPAIESVADVSTSDVSVANPERSPLDEQVPEDPLPEGFNDSPSALENEDWDMFKDDDSDVVVVDGPSETGTDRPLEEDDDMDGPNAAHEILHHEAASQSRLTRYSPPLMLSVLTAHHPPHDQVTYSRGEDDETSRTTNPLLLCLQSNSSAPVFSLDPNRVLCQFESVGGACRDPGCQDLHFKDFEAQGGA